MLQGQPVDLTLTEFRLLQILMEWPGYAFTRNELIEQGLGYTYDGMDRTLDSHIKNLRKKIEPDPAKPIYIETVYGVGLPAGRAARDGQGERDMNRLWVRLSLAFSAVIVVWVILVAMVPPLLVRWAMNPEPRALKAYTRLEDELTHF